ncbi:MAG: glycosyltransferase [Promethearchaeota archaeon]
MKILFIGVFNKPWSTNIPMAQELSRKNHLVKKFDFRELSTRFRKLNFIYYVKIVNFLVKKIDTLYFLPKKLKTVKYFLLGNRSMNKNLFSEVEHNNYDLIILAKTNEINYNLIPKLNKYSHTFYYFMDALSIAINMNADIYAKFSTWSSSSYTSVYKYFNKKGANSYFLTQGIDTRMFKPSDIVVKKEIDVIFVGTFSEKRERYINFLKKNKINVVCYGNGWNNKPIYLKDLVNKYRIAKVILNFNQEKVGFSVRVFQVIGTGSFLLSEYCKDLEKIFKKKIHLDWFSNEEECLKLVKYYLKNEEIREKIALQGYELILRKYTWEKIMERLIEIVKTDI